MRVCCYITSGDDFHCNMTLTSALMLRQHNRDIKVRVFLIDAHGETKLDKFADQLGLEVIRRPSVDKYFCLNRTYLAECEEDSVLYIDGDTFIFGDIESIFNKHRTDFAAATDEWITGQPDWNYRDLEKSYEIIGSEPVPVFNGGLTLWNNGSVRGWASTKLSKYCSQCQNGDFPIEKWLFNNGRECYHKETFSICFYVSEQKFTYSVMDSSDVVNLFSEKELKVWDQKNYVVYHCFTQNWKRFARTLNKKRVFPNRLFGG